jgi:hypothetical protein
VLDSILTFLAFEICVAHKIITKKGLFLPRFHNFGKALPHDMTLYTTIGEFNSMKRPLDVDIMIGIGIFAVLAMAAYCRV